MRAREHPCLRAICGEERTKSAKSSSYIHGLVEEAIVYLLHVPVVSANFLYSTIDGR